MVLNGVLHSYRLKTAKFRGVSLISHVHNTSARPHESYRPQYRLYLVEPTFVASAAESSEYNLKIISRISDLNLTCRPKVY